MALHYVSDASFRWIRKRHGQGFQYLDFKGKPLKGEERTLAQRLVIPPAWSGVKISHDEDAHIQAVGFDAKGRKQYIYHPDWIQKNQQHKFDKMIRFGEVLPTVRETIAGHMRQRNLSRERVLATIVWLLENTFVRVGNKEYARDNQSYGLTTLREKHVTDEGKSINFSFPGKSGIFHELDITHPRVVKTIRKCLELPGYELFQYLDETRQRQQIDSKDVNEYLHTLSGEELSAKDFRTWGGTTLAADFLFKVGSPPTPEDAKKALVLATKEVSHQLRNTVAVCRKYYIHPQIVTAYEQDELVPHFEKMHKSYHANTSGLSLEEAAAWTLLQEKGRHSKL